MIRTIGRTIQGVRMLGRGELKSYMRGYLDQALQSRGYVRDGASGSAVALPMLGAFSAGVAFGTGLGVLIAPASGRETRQTLRRRLDELMGTSAGDAHEAKVAKEEPRRPSAIITDDPAITHGGPMGH